MPIITRVIVGDGLDVVKVKALLQVYVSAYGENLLKYLSTIAKEVYDTIVDKCHLPLDPLFSNFVGRIAPYMSFAQVENILRAQLSPRDWQENDIHRLRYVYVVKHYGSGNF